jgi:hypothetical protein
VDEHGGGTVPAPGYLAQASLARTLVEVTSRALRGVDCTRLTATRDRADRDGEAPLPARRAGEVDAAAVARWVVDQYREAAYAGVVIGSAHGGAAHLAAAAGVPWLPTGFEVDIDWTAGCMADAASAMALGTAAARRVIATNDGVRVRQVHDPVRVPDLGQSRVTLHVRWQSLPEAYRTLLAAQLDRGGFVLLTRDVRPWTVLDPAPGCTFQIGSPASGLDADGYAQGSDGHAVVRRSGPGATWRTPGGPSRRDSAEHSVEPGIEVALRRWARGTDVHVYSLLYHGADALSAALADVHRGWLRQHGRPGDELVVAAGRLIDPWQVVRTGVVPYWVESATRASVGEAELWLAGSEPFGSIEVLPEPPGGTWSQVAPMAQWSVLARFATRRGVVNPAMSRAYPLRPLAPRHATEALRTYPFDLPVSGPLRLQTVMNGLRHTGSTNGILLSYGTATD